MMHLHGNCLMKAARELQSLAPPDHLQGQWQLRHQVARDAAQHARVAHQSVQRRLPARVLHQGARRVPLRPQVEEEDQGSVHRSRAAKAWHTEQEGRLEVLVLQVIQWTDWHYEGYLCSPNRFFVSVTLYCPF